MEHRVLLSWQAKEYEFKEKSRAWYWTVGIIAAGIATSAFIVGNYLFMIAAVIGGFTVMLVGSVKPKHRTYQFTEHGFMVGRKLFHYRDMLRFSIREEEPQMLTIETKHLMGIISAPIGNTDRRAIEMELKNRNVEEVESLDSFVDKVTSGIGL